MEPTHIFINGCSFLTYRSKDGIMTHAGKELEKLMGLARGGHLAGGGRGNKRVSITTKIWCERNQELAKKCFFVIGITSGSRFDFPTDDGYKKYKFPDLESTWKTYSPQKDTSSRNFFKNLFKLNLDIDQLIQYESIEATVNLQNFFKLNKYPYVMYKTISDTPIKNADVRTLWNMIDKKRFFKIETSHYDYILENKLVANMADPHPSEEGHRRWANELKEFIDANNLLSI
tara:strand:+ start:107 stop:799 length:693 start_codon:yes stop_codon:yes gene_type:complete